MSQLIGKLIENVKYNKYLNDGIDIIKKNQILYKSFEVCNIAKEVYEQVQREEENGKKVMEEQYLDAAVKVTKLPKKDLRKRLDY